MAEAIISLIGACITMVIAIYLIRTRPDTIDETSHQNLSNLETKIREDVNGIWKSWTTTQFLEFLSGFLLEDEIKVVEGMARFMCEDITKMEDFPISECGWRNKHKIITATGVSQRIIYSRNGILERLLELSMVEIREASTGWGKQKHHYRLNPSNEFMHAFQISMVGD